MRLKKRVGPPSEWLVEERDEGLSWRVRDLPPLIDKRKSTGRVQAARRDRPVGWKQAHPARPGRPQAKKRGPGK